MTHVTELPPEWEWPPPVRRPRRRPMAVLGVVGVLALATIAGMVGVGLFRASRPLKPSPSCAVATSTGRLHLDLGQAANAATIAAVGKRLGLVDHAVTVALVASLQETKLRNLPYGDRDSVGLFQQRPSQGWGAPSELIVPAYAATAFYKALVKVPGWEVLPVGDAAQDVQRSAAPDAYAPWETQGRALAEALTGEAGPSFTCRFDLPATVTAPDALESAVDREIGSPALGVSLPEARGWVVAHWLVAHAYDYRFTSVSFLGRRWTPSSGTWVQQGPVLSEVQVGRT